MQFGVGGAYSLLMMIKMTTMLVRKRTGKLDPKVDQNKKLEVLDPKRFFYSIPQKLMQAGGEFHSS